MSVTPERFGLRVGPAPHIEAGLTATGSYLDVWWKMGVETPPLDSGEADECQMIEPGGHADE